MPLFQLTDEQAKLAQEALEVFALRFDDDGLGPSRRADEARSLKGVLAKPIPIRVWFGTIDHNRGMNFYASWTKAGLLAQLAGFCRDYWKDAFGHELGRGEDETSLPDGELVEAYFDHQADAPMGLTESCDSVELQGTIPEPKPIPVYVILEGGMVQAICTPVGSESAITAAVIDYDTDGSLATDLTTVTQGDGSLADAIVTPHPVEALEVTLNEGA